MREQNAMQVAYARTKGKRYAETFRCPGGALCLDFCNSGQGIRGSQEEWIPTYADVVDWLEAAGTLTESQTLRLRAGGAEAPRRRSSYSSGRSPFARRWRACCWLARK